MSRATTTSASSERRRPAACQRCHKRKVRCSGGVPCQNCQIAGIVCTFPTRDRNVVVSEAYLQRLQAFAESQSAAAAVLETGAASQQNHQTPGLSSYPGIGRGKATLTLKHATAEAFVSGLKKLSTRDTETSPGSNQNNSAALHPDAYSDISGEVSNYDYVSLNYDSSWQNVSIQLPPYPYAIQLVSQFETFMAYEYHWYLRREFRSSLETTYKSPDSARSKNRIWLCKLLAVLALGESFNSYEPPLIDLNHASEDNADSVHLRDNRETYLPGVRFFEKALSLFKMPSEEPDIEHIEALNLITFFCYSLNRRKTAYMYAGMSARIANSLMLHVPATTDPPVIAEHRRRVWWTTFLIDTMVSSEMGLRAAFQYSQAEHSTPTDDQLLPTQCSDFWDSTIMTAHLKLVNIRGLILEAIGHVHEMDFTSYQKVITVPLSELELWKSELPQDINFDFTNGVPPSMVARPSMRSLASCYLRYHQGHIMLIRPVFFKLLGIVLGKDTDMSSIDDLLALAARCLEVAKCNMRIVTTLSDLSLLAKYGFYDSLHLFSSIIIFSLSRLVNNIRPLSLIQEPQDLALYSSARDLLLGMAASGNLASKGHMRMLEDIENHLDGISESQDAQMLNFRLDEISPWIDSIGGSEFLLDMSGFPEFTPDTI